MRSRQDGTGMAPYAAESRREIRTLGPGGRGNAEGLADSIWRGVTPARAAEAADRSVSRPGDAEEGGTRRKRAPPSSRPR